MEEQLKLALEDEDLTTEEERILRFIIGRPRAQAIKIRDLAARLGMNERAMRQVINLLRIMGYPIGSSSNQPAGYFEIRTLEELEETCRMFKRRALDELYVCSRLRKCSLPELLHQLKLEIEEKE